MFRISGGEVYDPLHGINGEKRDIYVRDGKIVAPEDVDQKHLEVIDASGLVVMAGGVDIHSHIAGSKVNIGRKIRPEDHRRDPVPRSQVTRSGVGYTVGTTFVNAYRYARLGYTTIMEAAVPPLKARHTHEELMDTPLIDKGCLILMGNNNFILRHIGSGDYDKIRNFVSWLLHACKGYGIKAVNPGGIENWKWGKNVAGLDDLVMGYGVTPRQIITTLIRVNEELGLPHPLHLHCNNLGLPGNYQTTLETMKVAGQSRLHLTHLQFHSYGGESMRNLSSQAPVLAEYINEHENLSIDVGQIIFGEVTTMTADGPWQYTLYQLSHNKWANSDVEYETGAGIVPFLFKRDNPIHATQWAIGLELFLLIQDPWRVILTTDHPNAGPFFFYPQIIKLLMDKKYRDEMLASVHERASCTLLSQIDREYSLYEIAIITRAGPARRLGLRHKGHLGVGADADIAIYPKEVDAEWMFSNPRYVFKDGLLVVKDGQIVTDYMGRSLLVETAWEESIAEEIGKEFDRFYSISLENYPVELDYLPRYEVIPCR
ncbi:formylmethanofuran dehydrogenase subunit A [Candidatus Hakubella thermalkaliphila]|uniref:Formylmethanofuran dehydrogenase subunit A n=3 Tax=Candidatus Hakubella thermalkaliphila TaxID=2754717 RepID=A0A6V8PDR1_9ACTN|nr:formylmethanofuran dehydrogenase subunit A [Candidatus Hakubella thermalkaliphila]GFP30448.1 formylmethanofuran dehydrogenase subunit A [Candidatus Hakubella thermalkaliphila]GFP39448.1 formylmethanofuran dehydrogenase subunit A [Candidatus Hakubella thermalkaliphila]